MEPHRLTRALIAGAGIAGLTCALALAKAGVEAVVFERAPAREAFGAVGGIAREYFTKLAATVGVTLAWDKAFESKGGGPATGGAYAIEPHKAEQVFNEGNCFRGYVDAKPASR